MVYVPHARMASAAFLEAYRRCNDPTIQQGQDLVMFIPAIVCAAFAAEVGIKALLFQAQKKAGGHDLVQLFNRLPEENRAAIISRMRMEPAEFARNLASARLAFKEWRYFYEFQGEKMISLVFLANFAKAVVEANPLREPSNGM